MLHQPQKQLRQGTNCFSCLVFPPEAYTLAGRFLGMQKKDMPCLQSAGKGKLRMLTGHTVEEGSYADPYGHRTNQPW